MEPAKLTGMFKGLISGEKRIRLIVALGLIGMALILLSQLLSGGQSGRQQEVDSSSARFVSEEYISEMEAKLTELVTGIEGVGRAKVMVTLENGVEYVYAQEEKRDTDITRETADGEATAVSGRVYEKENIEQKYILIEQNGEKQPLVTTEKQPRIQGVVIVCDGADDVRVERDLINVVTTALNVSSNRVCVVKINSDQTD